MANKTNPKTVAKYGKNVKLFDDGSSLFVSVDDVGRYTNVELSSAEFRLIEEFCGLTTEGAETTIGGVTVQNRRDWDEMKFIDDRGSGFFVDIDDLEDIADKMDTYERGPSIEDGLYLHAVAYSGPEGAYDVPFGCIVPLDSEFVFEDDATYHDYIVFWREADDVSNYATAQSTDSPSGDQYDCGWSSAAVDDFGNDGAIEVLDADGVRDIVAE